MSRIDEVAPAPRRRQVHRPGRRQDRPRGRPQGQSHRNAARRHHPGSRRIAHLIAQEHRSDKQAAFHGLARSLVFNAVTGVTTGWTKDLDIVGIGYRAELKGKHTVVVTLGYSHPIEFPLPTGIEVAIDPKQTHLTISGIDRQKVGQIAADMRSLRKPDPYKNKGVRYTGEKLKKKVRQDRREVSFSRWLKFQLKAAA